MKRGKGDTMRTKYTEQDKARAKLIGQDAVAETEGITAYGRLIGFKKGKATKGNPNPPKLWVMQYARSYAAFNRREVPEPDLKIRGKRIAELIIIAGPGANQTLGKMDLTTGKF
jgi:hypothetical protein